MFLVVTIWKNVFYLFKQLQRYSKKTKQILSKTLFAWDIKSLWRNKSWLINNTDSWALSKICFLLLFLNLYWHFSLLLEFCSGWLCFWASIVFIGVLTAVIGDVSSHLGCTVGLKDAVTAICFVAMGTSLPGKWSYHVEYFRTNTSREKGLTHFYKYKG